jgi:S-adenosylmethionine:tRNA ribosyltransferase-isomerase
MKKSDFYYDLPAELIAQKPLPERSSSRLLYVDAGSGEILDRQFVDFIDLLDAKDLLVFNDTKVISARLFGKKQTGGKVEILIERIVNDHHAIAHVRASKSPQAGATIFMDKGYSCIVQDKNEDLFELEFHGHSTLPQILEDIGHMPLPPYINREDDRSDQDRYQTVFAREAGAVAAPTAGLHFDRRMLKKIGQKGVQTTFVTLHVGSGTFQPVRVENLADHHMHKEFYKVSQNTVASVQAVQQRGGRVIAIGTTAVRALESAAASGILKSGYGDTNLFITPGYQFKIVDAMLTNFHLPESTLLMLVAAFAGYERMMATYRHAINESYRFFSYGDAMFISKAY